MVALKDGVTLPAAQRQDESDRSSCVLLPQQDCQYGLFGNEVLGFNKRLIQAKSILAADSYIQQ